MHVPMPLIDLWLQFIESWTLNNWSVIYFVIQIITFLLVFILFFYFTTVIIVFAVKCFHDVMIKHNLLMDYLFMNADVSIEFIGLVRPFYYWL